MCRLAADEMSRFTAVASNFNHQEETYAQISQSLDFKTVLNTGA